VTELSPLKLGLTQMFPSCPRTVHQKQIWFQNLTSLPQRRWWIQTKYLYRLSSCCDDWKHRQKSRSISTIPISLMFINFVKWQIVWRVFTCVTRNRMIKSVLFYYVNIFMRLKNFLLGINRIKDKIRLTESKKSLIIHLKFWWLSEE
jgi:hypothetical protein